MASKKDVEKMSYYLQYPKSIAKALYNISQVKHLRYKFGIIIPKVKIVYVPPDEHRVYGRLECYINGIQLRGFVSANIDEPAFAEHFFGSLKKTQEWMDLWWRPKISSTLNSVSRGATYKEKTTRELIEFLFKVKTR